MLSLRCMRVDRYTEALQQGDNWNELLKEVVTFDSVEEFWGVYVSQPL